MDSIIEEIKARLSLSDAINYATPYLRVKVRGNKGLAKCPFHRDYNPSLSLDFNKNKFYCHGCGAHGDQLDYVGMIYDLPLKDVLSLLSRELNIKRDQGDLQKLKQQIEEEKLLRKLTKTFDEKVANYYSLFCEIYKSLCKMIDLIDSPEDLDRSEIVKALHWKTWWEEILDGMSGENTKDKIMAIEIGRSWLF
ncbi:MAG: CHC2 zinc finger domain-containing protein [Peptococcales bacterium]|jgi:hypothetical protein